jgi:hypothetical protein
MPRSFDPYHRWLGIRPEEQPPNHYRLLGLALFEDDSEAISDAAQRQMAHVRTYQLGPNSAVSQKILNELAAAKACLLNPQSKADYDTHLREEQAAKAAATNVPPAKRSWWIVAGVGTAALLCLLACIVFLSGRASAPPQIAQSEPTLQADHQPTVQPPVPQSPPPIPSASTSAPPQANATRAVIQPAAPNSPAVSQEKPAPPPTMAQPVSTPVSVPPAPSQPPVTPPAPSSQKQPATIVHTIVPSPLSDRSETTTPHARPEPIQVPSKVSKGSKGGVISLFNGRNLNGWHLRDSNGPPSWSVYRGELVCSGQKKGQDLITDRVFLDFELHLEFMLTPGSNTGVFLRGLYEVQLWDNNSTDRLPSHRCGAIHGKIPPSEDAYLGPGRWHTLDVKMVVQRVTVTMNGTCIIRDAFVSESTASKFTLPIKYGEPGPIMLQSWERESRFRNIQIRPLSRADRAKD